MNLEEQYNREVKAILAQYPAGSREREEAKRALWERFQRVFLRLKEKIMSELQKEIGGGPKKLDNVLSSESA